ncbi:MAG: T9SS type A sorting domain-containing protein [Flavipsychrobacter sp.]
MKKRYALIAGIGLLLSTSAMAQMPTYNFSYYTDTYTPLTGGTSVNGSTIWDGGVNSYAVPVGFTFQVDTATTSTCFLRYGYLTEIDSSSAMQTHGFSMIDADLVDRGKLAGTSSLSPIRYEVSGTPGSRIFKLEMTNAGFQVEDDKFGTLNDYINIQEWWYEGSNIVELRYGPSQVTYSIYFDWGGKPLIFYTPYKSLSGASGGGTYYVVSGDPAAPTIDSVVFGPMGNPTYMGTLLNSYPANGQVYRFTPKNLGVTNVALQNVHVYPTAAQTEVMVDYNSNEKASYTVVSINGSATNINGTLSHGTTHIDVSALPAGVYLVELQSSNGRATRKFVKM